MTDVKHLLEADQLPALIVHAVNSLSDYEAAVDALEWIIGLVDTGEGGDEDTWDAAYAEARAVLRRLREKVPA